MILLGIVLGAEAARAEPNVWVTHDPTGMAVHARNHDGKKYKCSVKFVWKSEIKGVTETHQVDSLAYIQPEWDAIIYGQSISEGRFSMASKADVKCAPTKE